MAFVARLGGYLMATLYVIGGLYYLLISPPLHLFYARAAPAGAASVYVPGKEVY